MTDAPTIHVTRARHTQAPAIAAILARAFQDDPVFRWVIPDRTRRHTRLPAVFAAFTDLYLPHDETYLAGDAGTALWAPDQGKEFDEEQLQALGQRLTVALDDDAGRALELDQILDEYHPSQPSFYLQFMGVLPEQQGKGVGSRLLSAVLDHCDKRDTPAYLEATSPNNRRLYERHGFDAFAEIELPQGPALWPMWREPGSPPA